MTLNEANINAAAKIATTDDALNVAIEMLDSIAKGNVYGSFEYLTLVNRMKFMRSKALIAAVREHSMKHYREGWDVVVECYEDEDILSIIGNAATVTEALKRMAQNVAIKEEQRKTIESEIF